MEFDGDHSDSTEDMECPLCMEEIDVTDKYFKPCPCGYQICRFCWNHIKEDLNGKCPACRRDYTEEQVEFRPVSAEELAQIKNAKKLRERERKEMDNAARRHLANARVVQKNLIYVVGIPSRFATEEHLKSNEFFGQFGKISRVVINRKGHGHTSVVSSMSPMGVFIFYVKKEDAIRAIEAVDGTVFDGNKVLRVTHGTTKYCQFFLKNQACQHTVCQYLHEPAEEADTFAKEELSRQALRDRNPRPAPFPTLLTFYKKDVADENPLPASATWAKPIGSQRTLSSPVPPPTYNHLASTAQPSDSEYSDSDSGRPMQSNLMDLIVEKKKKSKKPASSLAIEATASPQLVPSPPSPNAQQAVLQTEPIPPGLFPTKAAEESAASNSSSVLEKSPPPQQAPTVPDEDQILGSKALNDGNDELVPNLIRRGPPNSAYAVARRAALENLGLKGLDAKKGAVSMYNMGFILQPTYNGLFDPFTSDPLALIRGSFLDDVNAGARYGKVDAVEDPNVSYFVKFEDPPSSTSQRGMYQNSMPQMGTPDDARWFEGSMNKTALSEFPVGGGQQWTQQQMLREQQQLIREQGLSENVLRQQQLARNAQFMNVNASAAARQQELLLLQQQQRFQQQQQQQYLGGANHDEFLSAFMREAQVRESQNQMRELQVRERNAALLNSSMANMSLKTDSLSGWSGASAAGGYGERFIPAFRRNLQIK
ncbi:transcriptional repressor general negative regulator of transcription subunit 4 [Entophlyctis luteolus]|nr:transcriptional repressor general negative regulator of transcription subunit 4 [Entophlyctis luteolus]